MLRRSQICLHLLLWHAPQQRDKESQKVFDAGSFRCRVVGLVAVEVGYGKFEHVEEHAPIGHVQLELVQRSEGRGQGRRDRIGRVGDGSRRLRGVPRNVDIGNVEALDLLLSTQRLDLAGERFRRCRRLLVESLERDRLMVERSVVVLGVL